MAKIFTYTVPNNHRKIKYYYVIDDIIFQLCKKNSLRLKEFLFDLCDSSNFKYGDNPRDYHDKRIISQSSDVLQIGDYSDVDTNADDVSSFSDDASHDELSEHSELNLNRLILLRKRSYRPDFRTGFYGPRYFSESDSDMDKLSVDSNISLISSLQSDSWTSIEQSVNTNWKLRRHNMFIKQSSISSTTLESSVHYKFCFTDSSGSEL